MSQAGRAPRNRRLLPTGFAWPNSRRRPSVLAGPAFCLPGSWGISLAMPQCLLWICLAVWEAQGDLPFIAENEAALMVNW